MATEIEKYLSLMQKYETKFSAWEFGDDDCLLPMAIISKYMAYCLKVGKPYAQLTDAEYNAALEA